MNMDAFFCITLGTIVVRYWWKHQFPPKQRRPKQTPITEFDLSKLDKAVSVTVKRNEQKAVDKKREQDIADLKKQGYTDELISVIIPTINNGG